MFSVRSLTSNAISASLRMAAFHEGLTLVQRDRSAAWFADPDGARLLICSEIGSEGRNFQFCHHLVMFDLPQHPDQLEQRIGRLDRIGQESDVEIHVPVVAGSAIEVLRARSVARRAAHAEVPRAQRGWYRGLAT